MKRALVLTIVCALFGFAVNVIVALTISIRMNSRMSGFVPHEMVMLPWEDSLMCRYFPDTRPKGSKVEMHARRFGWRSRRASPSSGSGARTTWAVDAGWPFLSLHGAWHLGLGREGEGRWAIGSERTFPNPRGGPHMMLDVDIVPLRPLVGGTVGNVLFYGGVPWLLLVALPVARRFIRRRRGWCERCGYDLSGAFHDRCPECGSACRPLPERLASRRG